MRPGEAALQAREPFIVTIIWQSESIYLVQLAIISMREKQNSYFVQDIDYMFSIEKIILRTKPGFSLLHAVQGEGCSFLPCSVDSLP